jgi:hypothetical protein
MAFTWTNQKNGMIPIDSSVGKTLLRNTVCLDSHSEIPKMPANAIS